MKKVFPALIFLVLFSACTRAGTSGSRNAAQKKFGNDTNYYLALQAAENGNEKEAVRLFSIAKKKGSPLIAKKSAEALTQLGSVRERIEAAEYFAQAYDDESSLAVSCRELFSHGEFVKIISLTEKISLETTKNEIVKYRLLSLAEKKDSRFENEFYTWFISRPVSSEHLETYAAYLAFLSENNMKIQQESEKFQKNLNKRSLLESQLAPDYHFKSENDENSAAQSDSEFSISPEEGFEPLFEALQEAEIPQKVIIDFRIAVFHRNYKAALSQTGKIMTIYKNRDEELDSQILSDIGKATLYATNNFYASARTFDTLAKTLSPEKAYFAHFYAARLYDKAGRYPRQTVSRFRNALASTEDALKFDNCLWYLLNFQLRTSTDDIIATLTEYGSRIHNSEYFDDFFESLSILLLSSHRWQDFFKVWKQTDSNFSEYTAGKYAYISGRLIEEGLAEGDRDLQTRQAVEAFSKVLNGNSSIYYKVCALERLNITDQALIESYLFKKNGNHESEENDENLPDDGAGKLLSGYAAFGFPQRLYSEWLLNRKKLTVHDAIETAEFLSRCAENSNDNAYNVQSLRIAARTFENTNEEIPRELALLNFPQFYKPIIDSACEEFSVPKYLMYALIRSESFFDSGVTSKAGANGLTQLMEATADDEAKKLKIGKNGEYDIFDAQTNVRMGTHYLSSLIGRTAGNNELLALYAYNAGLTNVRNWVSRFKKDWETTGKPPHQPVGISMDLFLESLPFAETREYGRKVISAAAMYAYLYENKLPGETVREIMY
ncbi:lytic transglycosylase domain-containing protein [uncultured Treponema sp.]|uniref:flagellar assembly lytic transglycosylase n=1 Tax=uncultured Treponema sp. TaxID=162155 RepID=UPI0025E768FE|nr:lytic transglycosylase domain-containing protein [uncultured Treponema sp.]